MTNDNLQKLKTSYPELFNKAHSCYMSVNDGWFNIIDTLCSLLYSDVYQQKLKIKYLEENGTKNQIYDATVILNHLIDNLPIISQVKEKFGSLRFYVESATDIQYAYIEFAESLSSRTCEVCGSPGEQTNSGWIKTVCETHSK